MLTIITIVTAFRVEKIKKEYDIQTYKEIVSFYENKFLTHDEKIEEKAKIPYQRFLLALLSAVIAFIVFLLLEFLIG